MLLHANLLRAYEALEPREQGVAAARIASHAWATGAQARARACDLMAASIDFRRGHLSAAEDRLSAMLEGATEATDFSGQAINGHFVEAHLQLAELLATREKFDEALERAGLGIRLAAGLRDNGPIKSKGEIMRARCLFALGDRGSALRAVHRASLGARDWLVSGAWMAADLCLAGWCGNEGAFGQSARRLSVELDFAVARGLLVDRVEIEAVVAAQAIARGALCDARPALERAGEACGALSYRRWQALVWQLEAVAAQSQGDTARARALDAQAREAALASGDLFRIYAMAAARARYGHPGAEPRPAGADDDGDFDLAEKIADHMEAPIFHADIAKIQAGRPGAPQAAKTWLEPARLAARENDAAGMAILLNASGGEAAV